MGPARARVCVIGDVLADTDIHGRIERLSPEAPVPVVDEETTVHRPGGAGLAATLVARAGADVTLIAALADDSPGERLHRLLSDERVNVCALPWDGSTVEKIRVRSGSVPLLRLDRGAGSVGEVVPEATSRAVAAAVAGADAVLVADYGRGVAAVPSVREAVGRARRAGVPVVWDPHLRGPEPVGDVTLVCPNRDEATSYAPDVQRDGLPGTVERARRLRRRWDAGAVAVTLGAHGAVVVLGEGAPLTVPITEPSQSTDTCGAGDAFAASAALALARGAVVSEAVQRAVADAAKYVSRGGATGMSSRAASTSDSRPQSLRGAGEEPTLVATGGCFDILHAGHVHTLRAARCLGDRLVVLVNDDESVRRLKGPERPLQTAEDRCHVLRSLADVDDVVLFSEDTPIEALRRLRPDVFVKGGDYTAADLPEAPVLAEWGGSVVTVPFLEGRSTTELVTRARTSAP